MVSVDLTRSDVPKIAHVLSFLKDQLTFLMKFPCFCRNVKNSSVGIQDAFSL